MMHSPKLGAFVGANVLAPMMSYKMTNFIGVSSKKRFQNLYDSVLADSLTDMAVVSLRMGYH